MSKMLLEKVITAVCIEVLHGHTDCEQALSSVCANMHLTLSTTDRQMVIHTVIYRVIV